MTDFDPNDSTEQFDGTPTERTDGEEITTPSMIGRYRVSEMVGKGGFGAVFRALDESLDRDVAIKVPRRRAKVIADYSPWMAEAKVVAMLDHPHIVPVYDVGSSEEFPFFVVSKFIPGEDLRSRMQRVKPSVPESVEWVIRIADALHHAHTRGLVHRDVKPSNVLIDSDEHAWLTDFGLALRDADIGRETQGRLIGTVSYMSPEQARGEGHLVDGRADVFALGIILYELLSGSRPFRGSSSEQLLRNIVRADPRPLRQWNAKLPTELDRICMKSLAQRRTDRYSSAHDMAADLRSFVEDKNGAADRQNSLAGDRDVPIIPKGLRSFDEHDREFFLKLVPGPRDRSGVPETLRQLRMRIEPRGLEDPFRVGLIYGSSGSGKSSLVRAGLVPLLDPSIQVAYIESDPRQTESRLLQALAPMVEDEEVAGSLIRTITAIRQGAAGNNRKVLIVLDQFEQWLHSHQLMSGSELVNAIRQCDGERVQCLLLIRDDFWMPATQFFRELEIRLVQDVNSSAVDRFEVRHARYVLTEFGRAYGCLPDDPNDITDEQNEFLDTVIESLQEDGKVISVRLVVVAQMLKGQPWNPQTLAKFGGTSGVDINFLEATFSDSVASPHHRALQVPARAVLGALLPEMDTNIKGQMQTAERLRELSELSQREFEQLIDVLDGELRLITPTVAFTEDPDDPQACYQLTHDFLVPPLREWLNRNESQTVQGRTRIRLRELSQYWRQKQDSRFLPNANEYARIIAFTSDKNRTPDESKLVAAATRFHGVRWATVAALILAIGLGIAQVGRSMRTTTAKQEARSAVNQLLAADVENVPRFLTGLSQLSVDVTPLLETAVNSSDSPENEKTRARLALVKGDTSHVEPLVEAVATATVDETLLICDSLQAHRDLAITALWQRVGSDTLDEANWLRTAFALAQLDPTDARWSRQAERLSRVLVNRTTPRVVELAAGFSDLSGLLVPPTRELFLSDQREDSRINAAVILSECVAPSDPLLCELLVNATPSQFEILFPVAATEPNAIVPILERELKTKAVARWGTTMRAESELDPAICEAIETADGMINEAFAWCGSLPLDQFLPLSERLDTYGYRPEAVRPYHSFRPGEGEPRVAVIWHRDFKPWEWEKFPTPEEAREHDSKMRESGLYANDLAAIRVGPAGGQLQYSVLWTPLHEDVLDASMYIGVTEQDHMEKGWGPLNDGAYVPRANFKLRHPDGDDRYSSVRWKTIIQPAYADAWNDTYDDFEYRILDGWHHVDLRLNPPGDFNYEATYGSIWWNSGKVESRSILRADLSTHRQQAKDLADDNFRPVSISVVDDVDAPIVCSVWHRPIVTDDELNRVASRQANALIALLRLGHSETLWPVLDQKPDPRLRSLLVTRLSEFGADPQSLVDRLLVETDDARRFALIASLAQFRSERLHAETSDQLRDQIRQWGVEHPSAAIHSICGYLCRRWQWTDVLREVSAASTPIARPNSGQANSGQANSGPRWSRASEGHTMVEIRNPREFTLGSPGHEAFRDHSYEVSVRAKIPRDYAIATAEVTLEQYQAYEQLVGYASEYTPDKLCPINSVSWYEAARYCRWLSDLEEMDEDQKCYPPIDQIVEGFQMYDDILDRTGYRLPTEAEWEYACRAMTTTSRYYGDSPTLLSDYAWTMDNANVDAQLKFHPVKNRLPNQFGLFDTLGNVMEWCLDKQNRSDVTKQMFVDTRVDVSIGRSRILRGSSVFYIPSSVRCANREYGGPTLHHPYFGFRIARTLPRDSSLLDP